MALISYNQQNDSATFNQACSGSAGGTTAARTMDDTAVGSTEVVTSPLNNNTRSCLAFDGTAPGVSSWDSGTWTIPINITSLDNNIQLARIHVCDFDGTSTYTDVDGANGGVVGNEGTEFTHTRGNTGVVTATITQTANHTPQSTANSRPYIVLVFSHNAQHGNADVGVTPDQTIDTPIDDGVGAATAIQDIIGGLGVIPFAR